MFGFPQEAMKDKKQLIMNNWVRSLLHYPPLEGVQGEVHASK
jgi:hypothetical protein